MAGQLVRVRRLSDTVATPVPTSVRVNDPAVICKDQNCLKCPKYDGRYALVGKDRDELITCSK